MLLTRLALLTTLLFTAQLSTTATATAQAKHKTPAAIEDDRLRKGTCDDVGIDATALERASDLVKATVQADELRGAVLLVVRRKTIVLHQAYGWRDADRKKAMAPDTLFRMASNSKALTAAGILSLVDKKKLKLEDKIAKHIKAFDTEKGRDITIEQLLTHTSGMRINSLFLRPLQKKSKAHPNAPSLQLEVQRFGAIGAEVEPGTSYAYSNPGYNTLAALIELASGTDYRSYLRETFYQPLGMHDSCNHESDADHARMSAVFWPKKKGGWRVGWQPGMAPDFPFPRGSGGMISTALDYAVFCQTALNGGTYGGIRVLSEKVARSACESHTQGLPGTQGYGYGWAVDPGTGVFSHSGSDGTYAWIDPSQEIIGCLFTQSPRKSPLREQVRRLVRAACRD